MIIFVPAWYKEEQWCENEQNWHERKMHSEFDDTVKQIQLFHRNSAFEYSICLLGYSPNLRHFLHRQGVYKAPYFSVFDAINECSAKRARVFSFNDLDWIPHTEFLYTPFVICALFQGKKYAQLEFGEDGNLIEVDMYEGDSVAIRNIYDDRGFVSSAIVYNEREPVYQDYYNQSGIWKIRVFFDDNHVEINKERDFYIIDIDGNKEEIKFKKDRYDSLDSVISEVFNSYVKRISKDDIFCVAMHNRHSKVILNGLIGRKTILSFFEQRYTEDETTPILLGRADYIVTDSKKKCDEIREYMGEDSDKVVNITPFDTRKEVGVSGQLTVQKILVAVDNLPTDNLEKLVLIFAKYFEKNDKARVCYFTREADIGLPRRLLEQTRRVLSENGFDTRLADENAQQGTTENQVDEMEDVPVKFFVEQCVDELSASKCIREQRLIINLSNSANLYLQISGVSFGIPQVVSKESQYVKDGQNGLIITDYDKLPGVLDYYLSALNNWNNAMIKAYDIGENYTTRRLVDKWKEVVENIG